MDGPVIDVATPLAPDRTYGVEFMRHKRIAAAEARARAKQQAQSAGAARDSA